MSKTINIFRYIGIAIVLCGAIFKMMSWPSASILLLLGMTLFVFTFLLNFINNLAGNKVNASNLFYTLGVAVFSTGLLFKIMHWPYASLLTIFGGSFAIIGVALSYAIKKNNIEDESDLIDDL